MEDNIDCKAMTTHTESVVAYPDNRSWGWESHDNLQFPSASGRVKYTSELLWIMNFCPSIAENKRPYISAAPRYIPDWDVLVV